MASPELRIECLSRKRIKELNRQATKNSKGIEQQKGPVQELRSSELLSCPNCDGEIIIFKSHGGAPYELPTYAAKCKYCRKEWDNLGSSRREATRVWKKVRAR